MSLVLALGCSGGSEQNLDDPPMGAAGSAGAGGTHAGGAAGASTSGGASGAGGSPGSTAGASASGAPASAGDGPTAGVGSGGSGRGGSAPQGGAAGNASSGGGASAGGTSSGGAPSTGGTGQAGSNAGGSSPGGSDSNPSDKTIPMAIPTPSNGQGEIRTSTTVLKNSAGGGKDVWDFKNQRIGVANTKECDGEGQMTVFEVEDGVTVKNLIIAGGLESGNGIVCLGNCTLEYVYWEDVCEDAATNSKEGATMRLNHVIAKNAADKVFQHNAKGGSKTILTNSYISTFGKVWRSCGDCTANGGPRHLEIDNVRVEGATSAVAGANQNFGDTVTIRNLFVKGGYDAAKDRPRICTEFIGVVKHMGTSTKVDDGKSQWGTATCKVSPGDIKSF